MMEASSGGEAHDQRRPYDIPPHPLLAQSAPSYSDFHASPDAPLVVTRNPAAPDAAVRNSRGLPLALGERVPINGEALGIDGPLFSGKLHVHVNGLPSTQAGRFDDDSKFRSFHMVIQGRFKRRILGNALWTGQEWWRLPAWCPTSFIQFFYTTAAKMFSNTVRVSPQADGATGRTAGFLNPVLASCQVVHVSRPGEEPADPLAAREDARLMSPLLADANGAPLSAERRRRFFDVPANAASVVLSPDHVYTLAIWAGWVDLASYRLQIGIPLNLLSYSEGQPLLMMAKDVSSGEYLLNLLVWHEGLLFNHKTNKRASPGLGSSGNARKETPCPTDASGSQQQQDAAQHTAAPARLMDRVVRGFRGLAGSKAPKQTAR